MSLSYHHRNTSFILVLLLAVIVGIYVQSLFHFSVWILLISTILSSMLFIVQKARKISIIWLIITFICLPSMILQLQHTRKKLLEETYANKRVSVIGKIKDKEKIASGNMRYYFKVNVSKIKLPQQCSFQKTNFDLLCYSSKNTETLIDDYIQLEKIIIKIPSTNATLSSNPTFADYLIKQKVFGTIFLNKETPLNIIKRPSWSLTRWIWQTKNNLCKRLLSKLSRTTKRFFSVIFLGNKHLYDNNSLRTTFNFWGISHYLARSGLHIVLFIFLWKLFFSLIPIYIDYKRIFLIALCLIYTLLSWTSLSFNRAIFAFLLIETGRLFKQSTNFMYLLSLICLFVLLINPMQLFFLDFQLTFGLTFSLIIFSKFNL